MGVDDTVEALRKLPKACPEGGGNLTGHPRGVRVTIPDDLKEERTLNEADILNAFKTLEDAPLPKTYDINRVIKTDRTHPASTVIESGYFCPKCGKQLQYATDEGDEWQCAVGVHYRQR